jgi:hypothetical protein
MTAPSDTPPFQPPLDDEGTNAGSPGSSRPASRAGDVILDSPHRLARHLWWIALTVGAGGAVFVLLATPHVRPIQSPWHLVARLLTFAFICCGVAFFPGVSGRLYWLLYGAFIFFVAYIFPRIGYFYFVDVHRSQAGGFYTDQFLLSYPGIVLAVAAAYRLGGGTPGRCLKISFSGALIIFSGLLDVMWWLVNPVGLPKTIDAPHITILTGGPISYGATIVFLLINVPIIVGINLLPLDRWLGRLLGVSRSPGS